jgi:hypothetical protein
VPSGEEIWTNVMPRNDWQCGSADPTHEEWDLSQAMFAMKQNLTSEAVCLQMSVIAFERGGVGFDVFEDVEHSEIR